MTKIPAKIVDLINEQIKAEMESAYLYLGMANYYSEEGLLGFTHWFDKQAKEEMEHAEKFIEYLRRNDEKVILFDVKAPAVSYTDRREPLAEQLKHEILVTSLIYKIMDAAVENKDYRTIEMLRWFVTEQEEEEENAKALLEEYDFCSKDNATLYALNNKLNQR